MKFNLRGYRSSTAIPSLRGSSVRYRPVIPLTVIGPRGQEDPYALVDTGSDDVVFPMDLAHRLGVDLSQAPRRQSQGVGSAGGVPVLFAPVILCLSDSVQTVRWRATVGFTSASLRFCLFGIAGGLEFFQTILDVPQNILELHPNSLLPATQDAVP
ncbi:MAG: retroviral-like aspartic protease family protein [Verrucomicrobiales bacterium]|nr:retroviral-like aspartic protease family protein [Verrucomicrobiales bacterium]